jgi:hypothetical protein
MSHNVIFLILCGCGLPGGRDRWDEKKNVDPRLLFRNGLPMFLQEKKDWTVIWIPVAGLDKAFVLPPDVLMTP